MKGNIKYITIQSLQKTFYGCFIIKKLNINIFMSGKITLKTQRIYIFSWELFLKVSNYLVPVLSSLK